MGLDPATLDYSIEEQGEAGRIVARGEQGEAELTYRLRPGGRLVADRTGVPREMGGMGVGTALVERLYDLAKERNLRIVPACPFVEDKMAKHPQWRDVLTA